eukprot:6846056-Prymnesium_polylepis.1
MPCAVAVPARPFHVPIQRAVAPQRYIRHVAHVQCAGRKPGGERCRLMSWHSFEKAEPLRNGSMFCCSHAHQQ